MAETDRTPTRMEISPNKTNANHNEENRRIGEFQEVIGAPGTIRTSGPQIRSLMLYPAELRARNEGSLV